MGAAAVFATPAGAGVVAAGLAADALFVFGVAVASAAFFFVGIVAFRSVVATAVAAAALVEFTAGFFAGLGAAFAGAALAVARPRARLGAAEALAFPAAVAFPEAVGLAAAGFLVSAGFAFASFGVAGRSLPEARAAAVARRRVDCVVRSGLARVALARFTEAAGCAAVRAAALDAAVGLAVRADGVAAAFAPRGFAVAPAVFVFGLADRGAAGLAAAADLAAADLVDPDLAEAAFAEAAFAEAALTLEGLAAEDFAAEDLAATDFATTGLRTAALAALLSRAAGFVLGDMSATPEIGRPPGA